MTDGEAAHDPLALVRDGLSVMTSGWGPASTIEEIRSDFAAFLAVAGPRGAAMAQPRAIGPGLTFDAAWIGAGQQQILYCHGGGFQIGGTASHASLVARLAEACSAQCLAFDYRLAPEHRYPAAADDAFAAYRWMLDDTGPPAALMGDSAGAALALLTAQKARDTGLPLPRAIVLISPWLDLSMRDDSYTRLADDDIFSKPEQLRAMARAYLGRGGPDAAAPEVSPLWGDLSGLPPILVHSGGADITLGDSTSLAERVLAAGGEIELRIFDGMCHHFQIFEALPEASESIAAIGSYIRRL